MNGSNPSAATQTTVAPLRVMVVDDSLVMRGLIARMIAEDPATAQVVATAGNGQAAVERAGRRDLDVVILDVEMPIMDGLTALPRLLAVDPRLVIIMASSLTTRNADISLKAVAAGAKDYVPKPTSTGIGADAGDFKRELLDKIRVLGNRFRRAALPAAGGQPIRLRTAVFLRAELLAIGSSTGGPTALAQFLMGLPKPLKIPVVITQHMPPTFTALLADNLTRETGMSCRQAKEGEPLCPGVVYVAPGDYHMTVISRDGRPVIALDQGPKENFCRPAVDVMVRSLVSLYPRKLVLVILTGMGQDGLRGAEAVAASGGVVVAQDEASSVVWGMPGAVAKAGLCTAVLPPTPLAKHVAPMVSR